MMYIVKILDTGITRRFYPEMSNKDIKYLQKVYYYAFGFTDVYFSVKMRLLDKKHSVEPRSI